MANKATRFYTVTIPTKTYLRKYIHSRYGQPIPINNHSLIGVIMISLLEKNFCTRQPSFKKDIRYTSFTDEITFLAPATLMYNYGVDMNTEKIIQVNRFFENDFEESLYRYCKYAPNKEIKISIEQFAMMHNIILEVDTTSECLKKSEYRYRKKIETISGNSVPRQKMKSQALIFQ